MRNTMDWTAFVSRRFLTGRRGGRGRIVFIFSVLLIGAGVATLITILSVMNGLQQGYIRSILEIGSYHLRWTPSAASGDAAVDPALIDILESDARVRLVVPVREGQTMLSGKRSRPAGALLRGVPPSLYSDDATLAARMDIVAGDFILDGRGVVLGEELAIDLGVSPGDTLTALDLGSDGFEPGQVNLTLTGTFACGYGDYESSLAFVSLETLEDIFGPGPADLGIKLRRPDSDRQVLEHLTPLVEDFGGNLVSWREMNRSFFGALRTEKVMMLLLLTLIFVVVAVNIDHALRRMATERVEDFALFKAIGASPGRIRMVFLRQGLAIGGSGAIAGAVVGVLIGGNIDRLLSVLRMLGNLAGTGFGGYGAYPMQAFFANSEVMFSDVAVIVLLAVSISSTASLRAAWQAAGRKPAEVLRSE